MMDTRDDFPRRRVGEVYANRFMVSTGTKPASEITKTQLPETELRRHHARRDMLPHTIDDLLDREEELRTVGRALALRQVVDLHGPAGVGKTTLISQAMHMQLPVAFPDGLVYLNARGETYEDVLSGLLACFYDIPANVKVSDNDVRRHMERKCALVALDNTDGLDVNDVEDLVHALPQCAVLVAAERQRTWLGSSIALRGLPLEQGVALFFHLCPETTMEDRPTIERVCRALDNLPLAIRMVAAAIAEGWVQLSCAADQVSSEARVSDPLPTALSMLLDCLSEGLRRVIRGLVAPGGSTVDIAALSNITGLPAEEVGRYLVRLERMGLVKAHSPRYSVHDALRPHIQQGWLDRNMRSRAAEYFAHYASRLHTQSKDPDEENVLAALDYYCQHEQWHQVIQIAEAAESYLATSGRWGQWEHWLAKARRSATMLGDHTKEAWAQNQLGIIALGRGNRNEALAFFRSALSGWQIGKDRSGMAVTQHNLQELDKTQNVGVGKLVPVVAQISAGKAILAEDHVEDYVVVEAEIADRADIAVRVTGDSLIDAAILNGDLVLVEIREDAPANGRIAAVIVTQMDTEATLKRFYQEVDHIRLEPANASYPSIIIKPASVSEESIHRHYLRSHPKRSIHVYSGAEPQVVGWARGVIRKEVR